MQYELWHVTLIDESNTNTTRNLLTFHKSAKKLWIVSKLYFIVQNNLYLTCWFQHRVIISTPISIAVLFKACMTFFYETLNKVWLAKWFRVRPVLHFEISGKQQEEHLVRRILGGRLQVQTNPPGHKVRTRQKKMYRWAPRRHLDASSIKETVR